MCEATTANVPQSPQLRQQQQVPLHAVQPQQQFPGSARVLASDQQVQSTSTGLSSGTNYPSTSSGQYNQPVQSSCIGPSTSSSGGTRGTWQRPALPPREELTPRELAILSRVDSLLFGVVRMHLPENQEKKLLLEKAVRAFEQVVVDVRRIQERRKRKRGCQSRAFDTNEVGDAARGSVVTAFAEGKKSSITNLNFSTKNEVLEEEVLASAALKNLKSGLHGSRLVHATGTGEPTVLKSKSFSSEMRSEPMDVDNVGLNQPSVDPQPHTPKINGHDVSNRIPYDSDTILIDAQKHIATLKIAGDAGSGARNNEGVKTGTAQVRVNGVCSPRIADESTNILTNNSKGNTASKKGDARVFTERDESSLKSVSNTQLIDEVPIELWAKLGHFNLLLEDYEKALSAYQQYFNEREDSWNNLPFMYGLGMVYYHYSQFEWAIRAFREILYLEPAFCRATEIYVRLGIMHKVRGDFVEAQRCFDQVGMHFKRYSGSGDSISEGASNDDRLSMSIFELQFHQAHLWEVQGKVRRAKEQYEALLDNPALPRNVRGEVLRQLGWIFHTQPLDSVGGPPRCLPPLAPLPPLPPYLAAQQQLQQKQAIAIQCLQKSIECDPTSGQSLYFLGRCFASVGRVHDAFISYRNSVDKAEANADTWCSIGVLYQQQSQPLDALQAYICAVQLDKLHSPAWLNLGVLYEAVKQPADALMCYHYALQGSLFNPGSDINTSQPTPP